MNGLPVEIIVVLVGLGVAVLAILLLRYGRILAKVCLVAGILAAVIIGLLAILSNSEVARKAQTQATVATIAAAGGGVGVTVLVVILIGVVILAGALYIRVRLYAYQVRQLTAQSGPRRIPEPTRWPRRERPRWPSEAEEPMVVYILEEPEPVIDFDEVWW